MNKNSLRLALAVALLPLAGAVQAAGIQSSTATFAPTTELISFDGYDGLSYDAIANPSGIYLDSDGDVLLTSSHEGALIGAFAQDLGSNGLWGARFDTTPTGSGNFLSATAALSFSFGADGPQAQVGAFFNHSLDFAAGSPTVLTLTAYGADMTVLESFSHTMQGDAASYNEGMFLGFSRTQADIASFSVSVTAGQSLVMDELHLSAAPVPEPATLALMAGGLGLLAGLRRRR